MAALVNCPAFALVVKGSSADAHARARELHIELEDVRETGHGDVSAVTRAPLRVLQDWFASDANDRELAAGSLLWFGGAS